MLGSGAHEALVSVKFHEGDMINSVGGGFESQERSRLSEGRVGWALRHPSIPLCKQDSTGAVASIRIFLLVPHSGAVAESHLVSRFKVPRSLNSVEFDSCGLATGAYSRRWVQSCFGPVT